MTIRGLSVIARTPRNSEKLMCVVACHTADRLVDHLGGYTKALRVELSLRLEVGDGRAFVYGQDQDTALVGERKVPPLALEH